MQRVSRDIPAHSRASALRIAATRCSCGTAPSADMARQDRTFDRGRSTFHRDWRSGGLSTIGAGVPLSCGRARLRRHGSGAGSRDTGAPTGRDGSDDAKRRPARTHDEMRIGVHIILTIPRVPALALQFLRSGRRRSAGDQETRIGRDAGDGHPGAGAGGVQRRVPEVADAPGEAGGDLAERGGGARERILRSESPNADGRCLGHVKDRERRFQPTTSARSSPVAWNRWGIAQGMR